MKKRAILFALVFILVINAVYFAGAAIARSIEFEYRWNLAVYNSKSTDEATYLEYTQPSSNIQSDDPDIVALANTIIKDISDDYEKARAIYNWVSSNTWYDWDSYENRTKRGENSALETLQIRRGVCVGYSNLTVAMLRAIGIPALVAAGHATRIGGALGELFELSESFRNVNHVWIESYIDGRWVIMDVTWASKNTYRHGTYHKQHTSNQAYFDISLHDLSKTHRYSLNYNNAPYPVIELTIPNGVESIVEYAFWRNASLDTITLPDSVTVIGYAAFGHCTSLKKIVIPDSVTSIGDYAFFRCTSLKSIVIPDSVTKIGNNTFAGCTVLKRVYIPDSVTSIDKNAFLHAPDVTIIGSAGSYAHMYAISNNIPFKAHKVFVFSDNWQYNEI